MLPAKYTDFKKKKPLPSVADLAAPPAKDPMAEINPLRGLGDWKSKTERLQQDPSTLEGAMARLDKQFAGMDAYVRGGRDKIKYTLQAFVAKKKEYGQKIKGDLLEAALRENPSLTAFDTKVNQNIAAADKGIESVGSVVSSLLGLTGVSKGVGDVVGGIATDPARQVVDVAKMGATIPKGQEADRMASMGRLESDALMGLAGGVALEGVGRVLGPILKRLVSSGGEKVAEKATQKAAKFDLAKTSANEAELQQAKQAFSGPIPEGYNRDVLPGYEMRPTGKGKPTRNASAPLPEESLTPFPKKKAPAVTPVRDDLLDLLTKSVEDLKAKKGAKGKPANAEIGGSTPPASTEPPVSAQTVRPEASVKASVETPKPPVTETATGFGAKRNFMLGGNDGARNTGTFASNLQKDLWELGSKNKNTRAGRSGYGRAAAGKTDGGKTAAELVAGRDALRENLQSQLGIGPKEVDDLAAKVLEDVKGQAKTAGDGAEWVAKDNVGIPVKETPKLTKAQQFLESASEERKAAYEAMQKARAKQAAQMKKGGKKTGGVPFSQEELYYAKTWVKEKVAQGAVNVEEFVRHAVDELGWSEKLARASFARAHTEHTIETKVQGWLDNIAKETEKSVKSEAAKAKRLAKAEAQKASIEEQQKLIDAMTEVGDAPKKRRTFFGWLDDQFREAQLLNPFSRIGDLTGNSATMATQAALNPQRSLLSRVLFKDVVGRETIRKPSDLLRIYRGYSKGARKQIGEVVSGESGIKVKYEGSFKGMGSKAAGITDVPANESFTRLALDDYATGAAKQLTPNGGDLGKTRVTIYEQLVNGTKGPLSQEQVDEAMAVAKEWAHRNTYMLDNWGERLATNIRESVPNLLKEWRLKAGAKESRALREAEDFWRFGVNVNTRFSRVIYNVGVDAARTSPIGVLEGLGRYGLVKAKGGKFSATEARAISDALAKGFTGTGLILYGYYGLDHNNDFLKGEIVTTNAGTKFAKWTLLPGIYGGIDASMLPGPFKAMLFGATKRMAEKEGLTEKQIDALMLRYGAELTVSSPITSGPKAGLKVLFGETPLDKYAGSKAAQIIPGGVREIAEREDQRKTGTILRKTSSFWDPFIARIPTLYPGMPYSRETLPSNVKGSGGGAKSYAPKIDIPDVKVKIPKTKFK